ncbi:MAG: undecaprenyl-phosphate glucose phosphotransferase, partial [Candidatus Paceibacterota bacterium]
MLKQKRQFFEILYVIADLIVISLAWIFAFWLRFYSGWVPVYYGLPSVSEYSILLVYIWVIWATVYKRTGLYRPMRGVRRTKEILLLINANAIAVLILIALTFLFKEKE